MNSIHQFKLKGLKGDEIDFAQFKGKKLMVVNVASQCGLTPQYTQLEELYERFQDTITIVGCPANNFAGQEPGTDEEIQTFCSTTYGVTFPMTTKISVKGDDMHPLYQFLTQKAANGIEDSEVTWNFQKYILDEEGQLLKVISPRTEPADDSVLNALGIEL